MANRAFTLAKATGMLAFFAAPCPAQPPGVASPGVTQPPYITRPTVSPYLNLTRRGTSTALNYYNLVRPQNQFYQSIQQLQQEVGVNTQDLSALQQPAIGLPATGHVSGFMTQGTYFMTNGRAGPVARPQQQPMSLLGGRGGVGATGGQGAAGQTGAQPGTTGARPTTGGRRSGG